MTIELAAGEERQLDVSLAPIGVAELSVFDVFIRTNYDPPSAADDYIHARIKNNGAVAQTREIAAYRWESWMELDQVPFRTQMITINPGETIEYSQHMRGNDHTEYTMAMWLTGDWTEEPLTPWIYFHAGYHVPSGVVEGHVVEVGADYVVLRYAEFGTCDDWGCHAYTPPIPPYEHDAGHRRWRTPWAYCGFWLIPGLLPGRLYEANLEGNNETWIQFSTL